MVPAKLPRSNQEGIPSNHHRCKRPDHASRPIADLLGVTVEMWYYCWHGEKPSSGPSRYDCCVFPTFSIFIVFVREHRKRTPPPTPTLPSVGHGRGKQEILLPPRHTPEGSHLRRSICRRATSSRHFKQRGFHIGRVPASGIRPLTDYQRSILVPRKMILRL